ncbi:unnamed protein product [Tenebrio molitor]|nr:unnamed protein product [Tenebrio molitor]
MTLTTKIYSSRLYVISFSGRAIFFFKVFFELHWLLPYHALNSELANFEIPCMK